MKFYTQNFNYILWNKDKNWGEGVKAHKKAFTICTDIYE